MDCLFEKAKQLLYREFEDNLKIVSSSSFHKAYVNEKIRHSLQVAGVGNGILAHESYFKNKPDAFIDICKTAILLHDIYRFREVKILFETGKKIDHGEKGAEFLSGIDEFDNVLITLPIKHHGHMIERLYEDKDFIRLDEKTKEDVKHIAFAVRDADKIANWYLIVREWADMEKLWIPFPDDDSLLQRQISAKVWEEFLNCQVMANNLRKTNADWLVSVIAWLFDINYEYSIFYAQKLDLFKGLCSLLRKRGVDEDKVETIYQTMEQYVLRRFGVQV